MLEICAASVVGSRKALVRTSLGEADPSGKTTAVQEGSRSRRPQARRRREVGSRALRPQEALGLVFSGWAIQDSNLFPIRGTRGAICAADLHNQRQPIA